MGIFTNTFNLIFMDMRAKNRHSIQMFWFLFVSLCLYKVFTDFIVQGCYRILHHTFDKNIDFFTKITTSTTNSRIIYSKTKYRKLFVLVISHQHYNYHLYNQTFQVKYFQYLVFNNMAVYASPYLPALPISYKYCIEKVNKMYNTGYWWWVKTHFRNWSWQSKAYFWGVAI